MSVTWRVRDSCVVVARGAALCALLTSVATAQAHDSLPFEPFAWPSTPPLDSPFELSDTIERVRFTGRHREYTNAECWFPTWAPDGNMYSPFADGIVQELARDGSTVKLESLGARGPTCSVGCAKIVGDDPLNLQVIGLGAISMKGEPYSARSPAGSLVHDGVWYYGTHPEGPNGPVQVGAETYEWPWLGPFTGFRISKDFGKSWSETPNDPLRPLFDEIFFDEAGQPKGVPIQIGQPLFVDFGKNMEHSPDGKAYLTAHGATDVNAKQREVKSGFCIGDEAYLIRVVPSPETINDSEKYEFFAGHDDEGQAIWTKDRSMLKPLISWKGRVGGASMTFNAPLKKYLLCVTDGSSARGAYDTYILESASITGPFKLVTFMQGFGEQGYFVNIPSKFISANGRTLWLCYSANFSASGENATPLESKPPGSRYAMNLQQIQLDLKP